MGRPDYSDRAFCRGCKIAYPMSQTICDICGFRVAHHPKNKKKIKYRELIRIA